MWGRPLRFVCDVWLCVQVTAAYGLREAQGSGAEQHNGRGFWRRDDPAGELLVVGGADRHVIVAVDAAGEGEGAIRIAGEFYAEIEGVGWVSTARNQGLVEIGSGEDLADGGRAGSIERVADVSGAGVDDVGRGNDGGGIVGDRSGEGSGAEVRAGAVRSDEVVIADGHGVGAG